MHISFKWYVCYVFSMVTSHMSLDMIISKWRGALKFPLEEGFYAKRVCTQMTENATLVVQSWYWTVKADVQLDFLSLVMVSEEHRCNRIDKKRH